MPKRTPTTSAIQSLALAPRLKLGWMSSMMPPKAEAPMKIGSRPTRPVRARGKASAAKAMQWTSLSLPSGAGGSWSRGQSMATVSVSVTISVSGMSRCLRIGQGYRPMWLKARRGNESLGLLPKWKIATYQGLGVPISPRYSCCKVIQIRKKIAYRLYKWAIRHTLYGKT